MPDLEWLKRPIAHRGLHDAEKGIVENTASAFQAAIDAGYAIETDVQEAGDGTPMAFHDASLERLTAGSGTLLSKTAPALKRIKFKDSADRILTIDELLEQVAGRAPLVIEIKSDWKTRGPLEARLTGALSRYRGPAALMSFDPDAVAACAAHGPGIPRGLVAERFADARYWSGLSFVRRMAMRHLLGAAIAKPHFIAYDIRALPALAPLAGRALLRWPLLTWTVRTPEQRRRAARWADAMIFEGFRP